MSPFVPSLEQEKVVAHRGGHLQVIAWAGAGKAIFRRVSSLIEEGVDPEWIVNFSLVNLPAPTILSTPNI